MWRKRIEMRILSDKVVIRRNEKILLEVVRPNVHPNNHSLSELIQSIVLDSEISKYLVNCNCDIIIDDVYFDIIFCDWQPALVSETERQSYLRASLNNAYRNVKDNTHLFCADFPRPLSQGIAYAIRAEEIERLVDLLYTFKCHLKSILPISAEILRQKYSKKNALLIFKTGSFLGVFKRQVGSESRIFWDVSIPNCAFGLRRIWLKQNFNPNSILIYKDSFSEIEIEEFNIEIIRDFPDKDVQYI